MEEEETSSLIVQKTEPVEFDCEEEDIKTTLLQNVELPSVSNSQSIFLDGFPPATNSDGNLEINTFDDPHESDLNNPTLDEETEDRIEEVEVEEDGHEEVESDFIIEEQAENVLDSEFIQVETGGQYIQLRSGQKYVQIAETGEYLEIHDADDFEIEEQTQEYASSVEEDATNEDDETMRVSMQTEDEEELMTEDDEAEINYNSETTDDPNDPDFEVKPKKNESSNDEQNPCTICQRTFKTSASLKRHITIF
ncbi:46 kDa FK506-binding nuclear protein-like [Agrilus planipennis]|uniref:46 kDa FK506-binding nuclear protein-like n=1 Tax=Agrilus planipennis TaxID=224129 RepID=A0A7F5QYA9_AGRPL|nr:46 kDa FK506-binding nuclear protein-like [Agrilus planipennis]